MSKQQIPKICIIISLLIYVAPILQVLCIGLSLGFYKPLIKIYLIELRRTIIFHHNHVLKTFIYEPEEVLIKRNGVSMFATRSGLDYDKVTQQDFNKWRGDLSTDDIKKLIIEKFKSQRFECNRWVDKEWDVK